MGDDTQSLTIEQVVQYLDENTDFFMNNPEALESLQLNQSPDGTISLAQRQTQRLQVKTQKLHEQLNALIENAHSNSELQDRIHRLCLRLMDALSIDELLTLLVVELKQEFDADEVALRLFYSGDDIAKLPKVEGNISQLHVDDKSLKVFDSLLAKQQPVCGRLTKAQKTVLFGEQANDVASVACLPLGHEPCAGILAIGSYDANRFHSDMGTVYLAFLGDVLMRLLRQYCHHIDG
ncbi:hypothetical protein A9Q79_00510 [Methylophaga sp. 42_25_T18]|nr:hypothetical protein A9Q79_00510 [Methylophaga sp. 42_25_T18]